MCMITYFSHGTKSASYDVTILHKTSITTIFVFTLGAVTVRYKATLSSMLNPASYLVLRGSGSGFHGMGVEDFEEQGDGSQAGNEGSRF